MEKNHLEQAKFWLDGAKYILSRESESRNKYAVATAMAIHAIIKANDALTFKFMNITAKRHDDARRLFEDLIKRNFIKAIYANYSQIIQDAITNKAKVEYRGSFFSKKESDDMIKKAEKFMKMANEIV